MSIRQAYPIPGKHLNLSGFCNTINLKLNYNILEGSRMISINRYGGLDKC